MSRISLVNNHTAMMRPIQIRQEHIEKQYDDRIDSIYRGIAYKDDIEISSDGTEKHNPKYYIQNMGDKNNPTIGLFTMAENGVDTTFDPVLDNNGNHIILSNSPIELEDDSYYTLTSQTLYKNNPIEWKAAHYKLTSTESAARNAMASKFAPNLVKEASRIMDEDVHVFYSDRTITGKERREKLVASAMNGISVYEGITASFVSDALNNKNPMPLLHIQGSSAFNISETTDELYGALKNIKKHNGEAMVYDLETTGRNTMGGIDGPNIIHEFSFSRIQGDFDKGDIIDYAKNKQKILDEKTENSIIGSTEKEDRYYRSLFKKFKSNEYLTHDEKVTLERLALIGNDVSKYEAHPTQSGLYRFTSFAEKSDLKHGLTYQDIDSGIETLKKIGKAQGVYAADASKMIEFNGQKMYAYEASILRGLMPVMYNENTNTDPLTLIGHNINNFDNHLIFGYAQTDKASAGFKTIMRGITKNRQARVPFKFDTLAAMSNAFPERHKTIVKVATKMYGKDKAKEILQGWSQFIKDNNKGTYTQESLMHLLFQYDGQLAAHVANEDAIGDARITFKMGTRLAEQFENASITRTLGIGNVLYATGSSSPAQMNLTGLIMDNMSNQVRTTDGFDISEAEVSKSFDRFGIRKHGAYRVIDMGQLDADNPLYKKIAAGNKDTHMGGMSYVRLRAVVDDPNLKSSEAYSDVIYIGDNERIQHYLNANMKFAGAYNGADNIVDMSMLTDQEKENLKLVSIGQDGTVSSKEMTSKRLLQQSSFTFKNESAARAYRYHDLKKNIQLLQWIRDVDRYVDNKVKEFEAQGGTVTESYKKAMADEYRTMAEKNTINIYNNLSQGKPIDDLLEKPNFFSAFGYKQFGDNMHGTNAIYAYSDTITSARNSEMWFRHNQSLFEEAVIATLADNNIKSMEDYFELDSNTRKELGRQFSLRVRNIEEYVARKVEKAGGDVRLALGYESSALTAAELADRVEIDLTGFKGLERNLEDASANVVRLRGTSSAYNFFDTALKKIYPNSNVDKVADDVKVRTAREFQEWIKNKMGDIWEENLDIDYTINDNDSYQEANTKLAEQLKLQAIKHPEKYLLHQIDRMNIIDSITDKNFGLSEEEVRHLVDEPVAKFTRLGMKYDTGEWIADAKQKIEELAEKINNNIITPDKPEVEELIAAGYSEKQAKTMIELYKRKRQAGKGVASTLINSIADSGGVIYYDDASHSLWVSGQGENAERTQLFLPRQRADGSIEIGQNRTKRVETSGVYNVGTDNAPKLVVGSQMDKVNSHLKKSNILSLVKRNIEDGKDIGDAFSYVVNSMISGEFRENITELSLNPNDAMRGLFFDINDLVKNARTLANTEVMQDLQFNDFDYITDEHERESVKAFRDKFFELIDHVGANDVDDTISKSFKELQADHSAAVAQFMPFLQSAYIEKYGSGADGDIISGITFDHKSTSKGYGVIGGNLSTDINAFDVNKRGILEAKLSAQRFDAPSALRSGYVLGNGRDADIFVGESLRSESEDKMLARSGIRKFNSVSTTQLTIATDDLSLLIQKELEANGGAYSENTKNLLQGITTTDGSAIVNPAISDIGLNSRTNEQRIKADYLEVQQMEEIESNLLPKVNAKIRIEPDGSIRFSYAEGEFVYSEDSLFGREHRTIYKKGFNSDEPVPVKIKEDGFLQHRYYSNLTNMEISENEIKEYLNQESVKKRILKGQNEYEQALIANQILNEKFTSVYRIRSFEDPGAVKLSALNEKHESLVLGVGFGKEDSRVKSFIKNIGEETGRNKLAKRLTGLYFNADILDSMAELDAGMSKEAYRSNLFVKSLEAIAGTEISHDKMMKAMTEAGFRSGTDFLATVYNERMAAFNALEKILAKNKLGKGKNNQEIQHFGIINNDVHAIDKHQSVGVLQQVVEQLQHDYREKGEYKTQEQKIEANKKIIKELQDAKISTGFKLSDEGNLIFTGKGDINVAAIAKYAKEKGLASSANREGEYGTKGIVTRTSVMQLPNDDFSKYKHQKIDERVLNNMGNSRWDEKKKTQTMERIEKSILASNKELGSAYVKALGAFDGVIKNGQSTYSPIIDRLLQSRFYTEGEDVVYSDYRGGKVNLSRDQIQEVVQGDRKNKGIQSLYKKGMSVDDIYNTIEGMKKVNGTHGRITADKVLENYSFTTSLMADTFNTQPKGNINIDDLHKIGFKTVGIDKLNIDARSRGLENSLADNKLIIDFIGEQGVKGGGKIVDEENRYLALPFATTGVKDKEGNEVRSVIQGKIARIKRRIDSYNDDFEKYQGNESLLAERRQAITDEINSTRQYIHQQTTGNKGIGKASYIIKQQSMSMKALGHKVFGHETGNIAKFNLDGMNIVKTAKASETSSIMKIQEMLQNGQDLSNTKFVEEIKKTRATMPYVMGGKNDMAKVYSSLMKEVSKQDRKLASKLGKELSNYFEQGNGSVALATRYPTNYVGSTSSVAAFFDMSGDVARGDGMFTSVDYWNSVKGDYDSDAVYSSLTKARATITLDSGRKFDMDIDYAAYNSLQKIKGISVQLDEADKNVFSTAVANVAKNTVDAPSNHFGEGDNASFEGTISKYSEDKNKSITDYMKQTFEDIARETNHSKDHVFTKDEIDNLSAEHKAKLRMSYDIGENAYEIGKLFNRTYDGSRISNIDRIYSADEYKKFNSKYFELHEATKTALGEEAFDKLKDPERKAKLYEQALAMGGTDESQNVYIEALKFRANEAHRITSQSAFSAKKSAGALDTAMYSYLRIASSAQGIFSSDELRVLQLGRIAAQEGATLSAKSEKAAANPNAMNDISKALGSLTGYAQGTVSDKTWAENEQFVRDTLTGSFTERAGKELAHVDASFLTTNKKGEIVGDVGKIVDLYIDSAKRMRGYNGNLKEATRTLDSQSGTKVGEMPTVMKNEHSAISAQAQTANSISQELLGENKSVIKEVAPPTKRTRANASGPNQQQQEKVAVTAVENFAHRASQLASRGGLGKIGAGIAAGIMGLGFLAGNHSPAPASHMAQDAAIYEDQQVQNGDMYNASQMPTLSDTNLNARRGGPKQGYVININAQTSGGQQAAQQAISGAVSMMTPQNGSINISMNTSVADKINQLQLHRMVAQTMGVQY